MKLGFALAIAFIIILIYIMAVRKYASHFSDQDYDTLKTNIKRELENA